MRPILAEIMTLFCHIQALNFYPHAYRPEKCPHCGFYQLWGHGSYTRKSDKTNEHPNGSNLNPIPILRYFCPSCGRTCSTLPECLPPRRWYQWNVQQIVYEYYLKGYSVYVIDMLVMPSIQTIYRWINAFENQLSTYQFHLKTKISSLGYADGIKLFWKTCWDKKPLSHWMLVLNNEGVKIP